MQWLIHNKHSLSDDDTVDCIDKEDVIEVMLGLHGGAPKGMRWCTQPPCTNGHCQLYANPEKPEFDTCCQTCHEKGLHTRECVGRQNRIHRELLCNDFAEADARAMQQWEERKDALWRAGTCDQRCDLKDGGCRTECNLAPFHGGPHMCGAF